MARDFNIGTPPTPATGVGAIGEVQASPTSNTVLERLKALKTSIDALEVVSSEITKWGGATLTSRDISLDFKALTDATVTGVLKSLGDIGAGTSIQAKLAAIQTATELIDNFISGARGLVTEDNSASIKTAVEAVNTALQTAGITQVQLAAIKTAVELIDNFISGARGLVTEDNSAATKTAVEAVNTALQAAGITQVQLAAIKTAVEGATPAGTAIIGKVGIDQTTPGTTNAVVEASALSIKTAVEILDNFISGTKGLVTEDNSATIKTAVEAVNTALQTAGITQVQLAAMVTALQLIDNMISGSRGLVTEDNSASIKTAVELIDNFISGSKGLVTEDSAVAIKTAVEAINTALQTAGITQAQFAAMVTALQLIDNAISGTEMQVDVVAALPAGASIIGKVGIDQTTPGTTNRVDVGAALPAGTNAIGKLAANSGVDIGDVDIPVVERIFKPFGKGSLTTDGVQYSAEVGSIGDTYTAIETVTINQPSGYTLEEIELALTVAIKSSGAAEGVNWKMQASDNDTDWQDLIAEQTRAASAAAYADVTALGRFAPTGNFLGTGVTFQVRAVVKSAVAEGETASGKMKNSSYIIVKYRRS